MSTIIDKRQSKARPIVYAMHTADMAGLVSLREGKHSRPGKLQITVDRTRRGPATLNLEDLVLAIGEAFGLKATLTLEPKEG